MSYTTRLATRLALLLAFIGAGGGGGVPPPFTSLHPIETTAICRSCGRTKDI